MRPEQLHLIHRWMAKAKEDYRNAEFVLTLEEDCPLSTICFHSQQCVEKYLKALLICQSLRVPRSHDLLELRNRIPADSRPELPEAGLAVLNRYAVEARYPGDWARPELPETIVSYLLRIILRAVASRAAPKSLFRTVALMAVANLAPMRPPKKKPRQINAAILMSTLPCL